MAPVGAFGVEQLLGAFGAGAFGGGERGDGVELGVVLLAEGVSFAGGVGADAVCLGAGVGLGLAGADGLGVGAAGGPGRVVAFAGIPGCFGLGGGDLPGCLGLGGGELRGGVAAGLLERRHGVFGLQAGSGGGGLGGAGVLAGGVQGFGQGLGLGGGLGGAGFGGHGGCLGAAPCGLGLGDLRPDPGRIEAGGLLTNCPGEHGGLADHRVQGGQRISRAVRGGCGRDRDAGIVVVAAGARVAAELAGSPALADGQGVPAARPLADGRRGRAGHLALRAAGGGIAGHDGTFRYQPPVFFSFLLRSEMKRKERAARGRDRGLGFLPGPAGRAGTGCVRTARPCGPLWPRLRLRRGAARTTRSG